jgi:hypothetical protein
MSVNLREQQVQFETVIALSIGPLRKIPFPDARSLATQPPTIPFLGTTNGRHYIWAVHLTKDFFPPIPLAGKGLRRPHSRWKLASREFPQATQLGCGAISLRGLQPAGFNARNGKSTLAPGGSVPPRQAGGGKYAEDIPVFGRWDCGHFAFVQRIRAFGPGVSEAK